MAWNRYYDGWQGQEEWNKGWKPNAWYDQPAENGPWMQQYENYGSSYHTNHGGAMNYSEGAMGTMGPTNGGGSMNGGMTNGRSNSTGRGNCIGFGSLRDG